MKTFKLTLTSLVLSVSISQAIAVTLDNPKGMALDTAGNLYVANPGRNNSGVGGSVLVYDPNYNQLTAKTIGGAGVNFPIGVAVNSKNQVYVANAGDWRVTVYNGTVQDTAKTLTQANGIHSPSAISIDGMDNVWVSDPTGLGDTYLDVFSYSGTKLNSIHTKDYVTTFATATRGPFLMTSDSLNGNSKSFYAGSLLTNKQGYFLGSGIVAEAMTIDQKGTAYLAEFNGDIAVGDPKLHNWRALFRVSYGASGIAVDNARNRVYVASDDFNKIDVYSTTGAFIRTIH